MHPKLILIVDDESKIAKMLSRRLKRAGYTTMVALNGEEGLKMTLEHQPDLLILDIHMPGMDGFDVIKTLRSKEYKGLVAACSASVSVQDSDLTLKAGCDHFINKPIDHGFEDLIAQILAN